MIKKSVPEHYSCVQYFLNLRNHHDSIVTLLADNSLNHDMAVAIDTFLKSNSHISVDRDKAFKYCRDIEDRCYKTLDGEDENYHELSYKARRVANFFAKMADIFEVIDNFYDKQKSKEEKEEVEKS